MLSIFKRNAAVGFSVGAGLVNTILSIKYLGADNISDIYFFSIYLVTVLSAFSVMPYEQFLHWYNHKKSQCTEMELNEFLTGNILTSIAVGILSFLVANLLATSIIAAFRPNMESAELSLLANMFSILSINIAIAPLLLVLRQFLNLNENYSIPYILSTAPQIFTSIFFAFYRENSPENIIICAISYSTGGVLVLLLYVMISKSYKPKMTGFASSLKIHESYKNSILFKGAGNIHYYSHSYFVLHYFSNLIPGLFTLYQYADKAVSACSSISAGPIQNKYIVDISRMANNGCNGSPKQVTKKYLFEITLMFVSASVATYLFIPHLVPFFSKKINSEQHLEMLGIFFIGLAVAKYINILESPSVIFLQSKRRILAFYLINLVFASFLILGYGLTSNPSIFNFFCILFPAYLLTMFLYTLLARREYLGIRK